MSASCGESRPGSLSRLLATRGDSSRQFGLFPLQPSALSEATMSALEPKQRARVWKQVDEMVWSLSWMHGESHRPATVTKRVTDDAKAGRLQCHTRQRLEERATLYSTTECAETTEEALTKLLKGRSMYSGSAGASTAPYVPSLVSLPTEVSGSPFIDELLPATD